MRTLLLAKAVYYTVIKQSNHLNTREMKTLTAACVFYFSVMFLNACCVLPQHNTELIGFYVC